jgi:acetate kinase
MGGLDAIVFTAGIGEHSPVVREKVCTDMEYLGIRINKEINADCHTECDISADDKSVRVLVIPTNEELAIARDTIQVINGSNNK